QGVHARAFTAVHNRLRKGRDANPWDALWSTCLPNVKQASTPPLAMIRATPSNTTMTATASAPTVAPPALAAFLRARGRRAAVSPQPPSGDGRRGDAAAAAALPRVAAGAAELPMAHRPRRFGAGLLAEPGLRPGPAAHWAPPFEALAGLGPGAR